MNTPDRSDPNIVFNMAMSAHNQSVAVDWVVTCQQVLQAHHATLDTVQARATEEAAALQRRINQLEDALEKAKASPPKATRRKTNA